MVPSLLCVSAKIMIGCIIYTIGGLLSVCVNLMGYGFTPDSLAWKSIEILDSLPLSEKKMVRKTLKRKCKTMSLLSSEDHQQHVDKRWDDPAKSHGGKLLQLTKSCSQL